MLNARTLAQAPTADETTGAGSSDPPRSDTEGAPAIDGTSSAEPLRPVEAFQTKEGVIVLSNRPSGEPAPPAQSERATPAEPPPTQPMVLPPAPVGMRDAPPDDAVASAGLWSWLLLAAFVIVVAIAAAALLARRKRRLTTARYAALLAGSEPIAPAPDHVGPFARHATSSPYTRASLTSTPSPASSRATASRTPLPSGSTSDERSSPRSAPPPSGISAPPASERQWLSQRPPRSYKQPPS